MYNYWYNGTIVETDQFSLSITDPAFLYGATLFTTLRVYEQSLQHPRTHWQAHCDRLHRSVTAFGWMEPDWQRIRQGAEQLLPLYPVLRITLFADGRELITGRSLPADLAQRQQQGITAWVCSFGSASGDGASGNGASGNGALGLRSLPQHKTGNYLLPWLALQQAQQQNTQEAILVDPNGNWLETSTGNLWGYGQGTWWTPAIAAGILPGIQRQHILTHLRDRQIPHQETTWNPDLIQTLELLAYSNTVVELIPIHTVYNNSGAAIAFTNPPQPLQFLRSYLMACYH
ncbi:MAG: aminotransferase class IV [Synechococcales bacterium]|nr:aminotransferase class IV [Synechococcales bacterium]